MESLLPVSQNSTLTDFSHEKTLSILILDSSSSMKRFGFTPIEVANQHIRALADTKDGRGYCFGLVTFADEAKVNITLAPVADIVPLEIYSPEGRTLLWETVFRVITRLLDFLSSVPANDRMNIQIAISVITDGEDNLSERRTFPKILQEKAKEVRRLGWKLLCYGIGINAEQAAKDMGFPFDLSHAIHVEPTHEGVRSTGIHMTQTIRGSWVPKKDNPKAPSS